MKLLVTAAILVPLVAPIPAIAQESDSPTTTRLKELTAEYELATKAYQASKAKSDAEAAAAAAKFGPLSNYQTAGTIEAGANSGKIEVAMLASEATRSAAAQIVRELCTMLSTKPGGSACGKDAKAPARLLVFADADKPTFDALDAFRAELRSIRMQLDSAKPKASTGPRGEFVEASAAGFSTALSVLGNLLRSDYKLSSIDISQGDSMVVKSFLREARLAGLNSALSVPSIYSGRIDFDSNPAVKELETAEKLRNEVAEQAASMRRGAKNPKAKAAIEPAASAMDKAVARFDAFVTRIGTPGEAGKVPLAIIARQAQIASNLDEDTHVLILKSEMAGGSAYAKKNFWTFFGRMPFFVSGGSLVSYTVLKGRDGEVLYAGVLGQMQPFGRIDATTARFAPLNSEK